jgi:hypothetical protein
VAFFNAGFGLAFAISHQNAVSWTPVPIPEKIANIISFTETIYGYKKGETLHLISPSGFARSAE